jgi:MFS family permease
MQDQAMDAGGPPAAEPGETAIRTDQPWPKASTGWIAVFVLMLATTMNFLDGGVFMLMIELIKQDFGLTDIQVGLLLGPAGIFFYVFVGIPLARLVDIYPRRIVLSIGLCITSGLTIVGGLVQSYGQLFVSRMFVGVGGSAHAPGSYSMIADYFHPKRLPRAIAALQFGFIFGTGFASIIGGALLGMTANWEPTEVGPILIRNWQWVLIMVGSPGLLVALCVFLLPEPPRRGKVVEGKALPLRDVFREIHRRRGVYYPLFIGLALSSVEAGGLGQWRAPFMMRTYGWTPEQIGYWGGITLFVAMPIGLLFGTWLTETLARRHKDANVRVTAILFALAIPCAVASPLMPNGELAIMLGTLSGVFGIGAAVPQNAAIQTITPNEMRGQVTAVYLFMFTVFGALGSLFIATVNAVVIGDEGEIWKSMALTAAIIMPLAVYAISRGIRPYGREIERLEAEGVLEP